MTDICVIGGTRYFGRTVVRTLVGQGHRVTVLTRGRSGDDFGDTVSRLTADANDADQLADAVAGREFDAVVHQMCYSPIAALAAVDAFAGRVGRLVMTSTIEVYQSSANRSPYAEESDAEAVGFDAALPWLDPDFAEAHYGDGKLQAEAALATAAFPVAFARSGHVLSAAGEFTGRLAFHTERIMAGKRIAAHRAPGRSTFVHADEIAAFLAWLATATLTGPVNAGSPDAINVHDVAAAIGAAAGREPVVDEVDGPDADLSPFSYPADFAMSVDRARDAGFPFTPTERWLPSVATESVALCSI